MAREDKMIAATRAKSEAKVQLLKDTVDKMIAEGIAVTPYSVGKKTGLSKTFIYGNEEAKDYIEAHRSPERYNERNYDKVEDLQNQVKYLQKEKTHADKVTDEVNKYVYEQLLAENKRLKEIVSKYEKLVEMGLLQIPSDMKI